MKSIKTGFVVVVMLGVVWGVWKMLNKEPVLPAGIRDGELSLQLPPTDFQQQAQTPTVTSPIVEGPSTPGVQPYTPTPLSPAAVEAANHTVAVPQPLAHGQGPHDATSPATSLNAPNPDRFASAAGDSGSRFGTQPPPLNSGGDRFSSAPPVTGPPKEAETASVYGSLRDNGSMEPTNNNSTADSAAESEAFRLAMQGAKDQLNRGELSDALFTLSLWYESTEVPRSMEPELLDMLDQLAGRVIYSTQHLLEPAYTVNQGETLEDIAVQYDVPWQLLANINGVTDPKAVRPGTQLKVVRGPFNARVNLTKKELTLFVGRRYAGRFPVELGQDPEPMSGQYAVREKEVQRTFIARDGNAISPGESGNPYGPYWIGLGGRLGIHGVPEGGIADPAAGSIRVSKRDAADLFAILSDHSKVEIRR